MKDLRIGPSRVYILSASDAAACQEMARRLSAQLRRSVEQDDEHAASLNLSNLAHTLSERRSRLPWVATVRARSVTELVERLDAPNLSPLYSKKPPRLGFVFNGQGAQWHAMGRELIAAYPVFEQSILRAQRVLREYGAEWDLYGMYFWVHLRK